MKEIRMMKMLIDRITNNLKQNNERFLGENNAFRSAVLIPLVEKDGKWHVLFEVRSLSMRKQPGDVSFPGGKMDPSDKNPCATAVRETCEELGLSPSLIQIVGELSPLVVSPDFVIYPFVGVVQMEDLTLNPDEVDQVFTVPVDWLLTHEPELHYVALQPTPTEDFPFHKIANGAKYQWGSRKMEEWFYDYEQFTIWGLTARILRCFVEKMK